MAMVWIQNPNRTGDAGKRYVTTEKAAMLAGSGWTTTTAPDGAPSPIPGSTPVTQDMLEAALLGLGAGGSTPDADSTTKGKARLMAGTADNPLYPASRITGQVQDLQIVPEIARDSEVSSAIGALPFRADNVTTTGAATGKVVAVSGVDGQGRPSYALADPPMPALVATLVFGS